MNRIWKRKTNTKTKMVIFRYQSPESGSRVLDCWISLLIHEDEPNHFDRKTMIQSCNLVNFTMNFSVSCSSFRFTSYTVVHIIEVYVHTIVAWFKQFSINNRSKISFTIILESTSTQLPFVIGAGIANACLSPSPSPCCNGNVLIYLYRLYH